MNKLPLPFTILDGNDGGYFAGRMARTILVARTRWVLLLLIGLYCLCAASFYYFSVYGLFLTTTQLTILTTSLFAVIAYNTLLQFCYHSLRHIRFIDHLQIIFDLVFVTGLIHFSGGAASWFWPVYLIVTIESSYLLDRKRDVWAVGAFGGFLYGLLLTAGYFGLLPTITMPFVDPGLHRDVLYLLLMWCWVAILNATVAIIGAFLMSVIRRENQALRESEERLLDFLDSANDLIFTLAPDGRFIFVNRAWQKALEYTGDEALSLSYDDIMHPKSREHCLDEMTRIVEGEGAKILEALLVAKSGRGIYVEGSLSCSSKDGELAAVWGICRDITERKQAEEQLFRLAHHDTLTGLPNRLLFFDRLQQANALATRLNSQVAVLFLDLDRFKIINDTLGHQLGDKLLQSASHRLETCVRSVDTVARVGGDEFTVILVNITNIDDVKMVAQKILKTLSAPFTIDNHELFITTSIGICLYPRDGESLESLVQKADVAMYHAKGEGRNNFQFYEPSMDEHAGKRLRLENSLRKAIDRNEFRIYYQPKVDIQSKRIIAMEALLRWQHPEFGLVPPNEFIPLAEETGMIIPIGEWVLRSACIQNREWQAQGLPRLRVAVNLSGYQFQQRNLLEMIKTILAETGLEAELLELEITESVIMQNPDFAVSVLNELKDIGVHISIDDFGTGYSSLAHLKRFSVNTLKIDKSFVRDVEINTADAAITTAIIAMGNSLNLKVIAEGVETEGQLVFLSENNCDEVQGFLFSTPMPSAEVATFLREQVVTDQAAP